MFSRLLARCAGAAGFLLACTLIGAEPLAAQGNVDYIVGTITDAAGKPVAGAGVEALSLELQVTKKTVTNDKGRFSLNFNEGGGQYRITVRAIGKLPIIQNVTRQQDDDRIVFNVRLGDQATRVQDLVANTTRRIDPNTLDRPTPGSTERNMTSEQASRLPIDASDLATLASLAPGVIFTGGTDSTGSSFSVAGQSSESNTFVIDGLASSSGAVPADAVRSTRVTTNTYDVSRGGFSGGQVSATTRGGSNRTSGSISGNFQNQDLALGGTQTVFGSGQTRETIGAGFGGPLRKDKLFLFSSFNLNRQLVPIATLDLADATTLARLGVSSSTVTQFREKVDTMTGYTAAVGPIDPNRTADNFNMLTRFDWNAGDRSTVTVNWNLGVTTSDPFRTSTTSLPQVGGSQKGNSGGASLSAISRINVDLTNEFRAGFNYNSSNSDPFLLVPAGRVTTYSTLDSNQIGTTTLGFGGNSGLPNHSDTKRLQVANTVSFTPSGTHRIQLGLSFDRSSFDQDVTTNRYGTYTYNSLDDFQDNIPATFTRTLSPTARTGSAINEAVFLSEVWRSGAGGGGGGGFGGGGRGGMGGFGGGQGSGNLQVTAGVRLEHSSYGGAPALNEDVLATFGVATNTLPSETFLSPRVGFSFNIPAREQMGNGQRGFAPPLLTLRGGLGVFRATMPATLPGTAQAESGLSNTESQLFCVGGAVPIPTWSTYLNDPSQIPTQCIDDQSTPVLTGVPNVTTYATNYGAAKTYRATFGLSKRLTQLLSFNLDASYVRGKGQSYSRDLNLNETAQFHLGGLDGRPNFAELTQIDPARGSVPLSASRKHTSYGTVDQVFSALQNETKQVTLSVAGSNRRAASINLSYTMMFARDQGGTGGGFRGGGFGGGGGNLTAGDPNVYEWGTSSNERRHNFQVNVSWPFNQTFTLTMLGRLTSGSRYTPVVQGDINGDGSSRNDRAFIFNPATTTDTGVANGMNRMLSSTSGGARACVAAQFNSIAGRNSCTGPWNPSMEFQVNILPPFLQHRLTMSVATSNFLGGLDELLHGENNIKGWGQNRQPNSTLMTVRGFDPVTRTFKYQVNERFGATSAAATATRSPMQLQLRMRYVIGYDQQRSRLSAFFTSGTAGAPSGMEVLKQGIARFRNENIAKAALDRKDSLALAPDQIAKLQHLLDSTMTAMTPLLDSLTREVDKVNKGGSAANVQPLLMLLGPLNLRTVQLREAVRAILTDVQWSLLPEAIRTGANFFNFGAGGRGQGGGGGGGRGGGGGGVRGGGGE